MGCGVGESPVKNLCFTSKYQFTRNGMDICVKGHQQYSISQIQNMPNSKGQITQFFQQTYGMGDVREEGLLQFKSPFLKINGS